MHNNKILPFILLLSVRVLPGRCLEWVKTWTCCRAWFGRSRAHPSSNNGILIYSLSRDIISGNSAKWTDRRFTWNSPTLTVHSTSNVQLHVFCDTQITLINSFQIDRFYARQLYRQVLLRARISYGNCLSVCPSVTTRYGFKATWDRDSRSSPYDSLESLVSYEVIWCQWVKRFPSNEGIKEGQTNSEDFCMADDRFLLANFIGRRNWPTFSSVWHQLWSEFSLKYTGDRPR